MTKPVSSIKLPFLLFLIALLICSSFVRAEFKSVADSMIKAHDTISVDSIRMIHAISIGQKMFDVNATIAIKYLQEAYDLMLSGVEYSSPQFSRERIKYNILNLMSTAYSQVGDARKGITLRMQQLEKAQELGVTSLEQIALSNLATDLVTQGNYPEALKFQQLSLQLSLKENDPYNIGLAYGNIGSTYELINETDSALYYYKNSIPFVLKIEKNKVARNGSMGWMMNNIGGLFFKAGNLDSAYSYYHLSRQYREEIDHTLGKFIIYHDLAELHRKWKNNDSAFYYINKSIRLGTENGFVDNLNNSFQLRSEMFREKGKYREALDDYMMSVKLRDSIVNMDNSKNILRQSIKYENKLAKLADSLQFAQREAVLTERTKKQRLGLLASAGGLILLVTLAYSIFKGKKRSDELLLNILPEETAEELKAKGTAEARQFNEVTVMFTDFKNFTQASEKLSPTELVEEIHHCYSAFDHIIEKHNLEKIKTIGDSYMCAGGLPVPNKTNAIDIVQAAMEICEFMKMEKEKRKTQGIPFFEIRIGCHTGSVVAGIVGIKKFSYDIWGDTVNIASRMESGGEVGKVNISGVTYEMVKDKFVCTYRGKIATKNKGKIDMYFVDSGSIK